MLGSNSHQTTKQLLAVTLAFLMITSVFAGGVVAADSPSESEIADEVYVNSDGDAVLVYEEDAIGPETGEFGADVAEGIVYAVLTDDLEDDLSAAFDLWVDPDGIEGSTAFTADRPDELEEFSMDVTADHTAEQSQFDASAELAIDVSDDPMPQEFDGATTQGTVESSVDRFASSGEYAIGETTPQEEPTERIDVALSGTAGDYSLAVDQERPLADHELEQWETEEAAAQTLEGQFASIAAGLGGEASVTIHEHDVSTQYGEPVLDIEYTVEYEGLDGLADELAAELAADSDLDLTQAESEALVDAVFDVELDAVELRHVQDDTTVEGDWNVEISNTAGLSEGMLDLFEAADDGELAELGVIDDLRDQFEAQAEADLVQTTEWEAELSHDGPETVIVSAALSSDAENWADYVDELEDRGIDHEFDLSVEASGQTVDDELEFDLAIELGQDEMLDAAIGSLTQELEDDQAIGTEQLELWQAFDDAGFEVAGIDVDMTDGTTTVTAGAKFDDFVSFQEIIEDEFYGLAVTHLYGDVTEDTETTYLHVEGMVDEDPTEDDVRDTDLVDDETAVYLDASLEDQPRLDLEEASEFLGLDDGNETENDTAEMTDEDEDTDETPGFGVAAAIGVLLSIALLRVRN